MCCEVLDLKGIEFGMTFSSMHLWMKCLRFLDEFADVSKRTYLPIPPVVSMSTV